MTRAEKILLPPALLLLAVSAYVHFVSGNATDKNWLLIAARMWISGKKLYVDIFEINPPLIVWLYSVPVFFSEHLFFLKDYQLLALMGLALIGFVIALSDAILKTHPAFAGEPGRRGFFALLLAYVFVFFTAPMYFLDREHILLVLTFPYILRFAPSFARLKLPMPLRVAVGVLGGVGFCIKPHAAIVFAVLQLIYLLRERSPVILASVENLIVYIIGAAYLSTVVFLMPEYLHTVLPMAMATYAAYSRKITGIYSIITFIVIMGVTFADFRPRYRSPLRREVYYFLGVCLAYLCYALANNGWAYTYNPLISMARIVTGWVMLEFYWLAREARAKDEPVKPFIFGARACVLNLTVNLLFYACVLSSFFFTFDCQKNISCRAESKFMAQARSLPAHSFGAMSLEFYKWSQLTRVTGWDWDTRFNHLWMLPQFILSGPEFTRAHQSILDYVGNAYADDMNRRKPDVMYIDASPSFFSKQPYFDLVGYFSKAVPAFAEAFTHYRRTSVIDTCEAPDKDDPKSKGLQSDCRFDIYSRIPSP